MCVRARVRCYYMSGVRCHWSGQQRKMHFGTRGGSCKIEKKSLASTNDRPFCLNLLSPCTLGKY